MYCISGRPFGLIPPSNQLDSPSQSPDASLLLQAQPVPYRRTEWRVAAMRPDLRPKARANRTADLTLH